MYLRSTSAAGVRFLAAIKEGRGLKRSAREAGVSKTIGYRWLRERYLGLRREGNSMVEVTAELGFTTAKMLAWEADVTRDTDRHHLRVDVRAEDAFWNEQVAAKHGEAASELTMETREQTQSGQLSSH